MRLLVEYAYLLSVCCDGGLRVLLRFQALLTFEDDEDAVVRYHSLACHVLVGVMDCVDADDVFFPNFLEKFGRFAIKHIFPHFNAF